MRVRDMPLVLEGTTPSEAPSEATKDKIMAAAEKAFWSWYAAHQDDKIDVGLPFGIKLTVRRLRGLFEKIFGPKPDNI